METITETIEDLVEEFDFFDDWMDRYQHIIDLGKNLPTFPAEHQTPDNIVRGCQSQVWLHIERQAGKLHMQGISDSAIVSGLIAVLFRVYNDRTPAEILETEPDFIERIGLSQHLSPTRSNGLFSMLKTIKAHASALRTS